MAFCTSTPVYMDWKNYCAMQTEIRWRMAGKCGLPFLNHELVEFVFSLPSHFKIREGWTKWLLRQSMKEQLPAEIVWRKDKIGFEPPQKKWMQNAELQEMIQEARKKLVKEKILKPDVMAKPVQPAAAYEANTNDWRYLSAAAII